VLYAFNQGEVCTCPSRALIQEDIYDEFMARCLARIKAIKQGSPLDTETMMGAQVSTNQMDKISGYCDIAAEEGAECLIAARRPPWRRPGRRLLLQPDRLQGQQQDAHLPGGDLRAVLAVTTFKDDAEALELANDTMYGLGAGVWTRNARARTGWAAGSRPDGSGRTATTPTRLGRVRGYKISGVGRRTTV